MLMKRVKPVVAALIAAITVCGTSAYAAGENGILVVPSRYTVVQLAFDIAALRNATLISYEKSDAGKDPVLYIWDSLTSAWESMSIDEYSTGSFSPVVPKEIILIGSGDDLPAAIIDGASQAKKVSIINTLNIADIVNSLNKSMKFTPPEWKALANKHGFTIKDNNEERRRWGRYGPPGTKKKSPKKPIKKDVDIFSDNCNAEKAAENPFEKLENELKIPEPKAPMHLEVPSGDQPIPEKPAATVKSAEVDRPLTVKPKTKDEIEFPEDK
jgi:hypothetical protein